MFYYSKRSHRRIVHTQACFLVRGFAPETIGTFETLSEAFDAGYRLCRRCNPILRQYRKEQMAILDYCRENGMSFHLNDRYLSIISPISRWRVTERGIENVRFLDRDAINLLDMFAPGEVSRIYINFPDPWKKSRQYKRRLTYAGFLALYANVLPLGGEIWFKTDNDPLFAFSLEQFEQEGWQLREVTHDLHADGPVGVMTDYEAKFYDQGITINRCVAVKTEDTKCDLYPGMSTDCAPV